MRKQNFDKDFAQSGRKSEAVKGGEGPRNNETITPLFISWLINATANLEDDMIRIDNVVLDKIKICGRVVSTEVKGTRTTMIIEDGTGFIELSCNKKFDEDIPRLLSELNLET